MGHPRQVEIADHGIGYVSPTFMSAGAIERMQHAVIGPDVHRRRSRTVVELVLGIGITFGRRDAFRRLAGEDVPKTTGRRRNVDRLSLDHRSHQGAARAKARGDCRFVGALAAHVRDALLAEPVERELRGRRRIDRCGAHVQSRLLLRAEIVPAEWTTDIRLAVIRDDLALVRRQHLRDGRTGAGTGTAREHARRIPYGWRQGLGGFQIEVVSGQRTRPVGAVVSGCVSGGAGGDQRQRHTDRRRSRTLAQDAGKHVRQVLDEITRIARAEVRAAGVHRRMPGVVHAWRTVVGRLRPAHRSGTGVLAGAQRQQVVRIRQVAGHAERDHELREMLPRRGIVRGIPVDFQVVERIVARSQACCSGHTGGLVRDIRIHVVRQGRLQVLRPVVERDVGHRQVDFRSPHVPDDPALRIGGREPATVRQRAIGLAIEVAVRRDRRQRRGVVVPVSIRDHHVEILATGQIPACRRVIRVRLPERVHRIGGQRALEELAGLDHRATVRRAAGGLHVVDPVEEVPAPGSYELVDRASAQRRRSEAEGALVIGIDRLPGDAHVAADAAECARQCRARQQVAGAVIGIPVRELLFHRRRRGVDLHAHAAGVAVRRGAVVVEAAIEIPGATPSHRRRDVGTRIRIRRIARAGRLVEPTVEPGTQVPRVRRRVAVGAGRVRAQAVTPGVGVAGVRKRRAVGAQRRRIGLRRVEIDQVRPRRIVVILAVGSVDRIGHRCRHHRSRVVERHDDVRIDCGGQFGRRREQVDGPVRRRGHRGHGSRHAGEHAHDRRQERQAHGGVQGLAVHRHLPRRPPTARAPRR